MFSVKEKKEMTGSSLIGEADYIKNRVDDQINWYERKSSNNKKWFRLTQVIQLLLASLITLSGSWSFIQAEVVNIFIPLFGAVIAITSGILGIYKFQENWITYRTTAESLKKEKLLFLTRSNPYNTGKVFQRFVSQIESILSSENSGWQEIQKDNPVSNEGVN